MTVDKQRDLHADSLGYSGLVYQQYLLEPNSVSPEWRSYFDGLSGESDVSELLRSVHGPTFQAPTLFDPTRRQGPGAKSEHFSSTRVLGLLRNVSLFKDVPEDELQAVAQISHHRVKRHGEMLFREGDAGRELFIVGSEQVLIQRNGGVIASLGAGEVLGEMAVLDGLPRSADAIAYGDAVDLIVLSGSDLNKLMERRPRLALSIIKMLSGRLRKSTSGQDAVDQLIRAYRVRGHLCADLNPLRPVREYHPALLPEHYGFSVEDEELTFSSRTIPGTSYMNLRQIVDHMRRSYCGSIGIQYMHIDDLEIKDWIQEQLEGAGHERHLSRDEQLRILTKLTDAEIFEQFIHRKFLGAKRFSLEGGESLIPLMDQAIEEAGVHGIDEVVIGMAHRGRLNVLANVMEKSPREIFREFDDNDPSRIESMMGSGDVKYHLGYSHDRKTACGKDVHLTLTFNPSHLECVGPVVLGRVRAKQARDAHGDRSKRMAIVVHGDSAFAGQGVVQEMLNMSELPGFTIGGTLHIIVNNQIGFTTPPESARSTQYATDVARMLQIPIIHVNGEHPEPVARAIQLALDFRQKFGKDVVIDMYCYRRYGHNETDEPAYTQPLLYKAIRKRKSVREGYLDSLYTLGGITQEEAQEIVVQRKSALESELAVARSSQYEPLKSFAPGRGVWTGYDNELVKKDVDTRVDLAQLKQLLLAQSRVPDSFTPHPKINNLLKLREAMAGGERPLDWAAAESLAYASLLADGHRIRLIGQDVGRGTFSHRHAVLHDFEDGHIHIPLSDVCKDQASIEIWDSPLTETAVLGFEYGYSLDSPDVFNMWEAQFGDFANVAQVIIDQFVTSGEDKWNRLTGLCMFLPHGYEGQGPEHSSARLERFLMLAAEDNIQVLNLTSPAQLFHMVRRQMCRAERKPLVLMSPKSLLRHPKAISSLRSLAEGEFMPVIKDQRPGPVSETRCILLTSGKLYYELEDFRTQNKISDVAIVRLEQYYPLRHDRLEEAMASYGANVPIRWVQEEPLNMGAWPYLHLHAEGRLVGRELSCVSRPASASPATGSSAAHKIEQQQLLETAFR